MKRPEHSKKMKGKNNPMYGKLGENHPKYGKSNYDIWLEKYGKEEADKREKDVAAKISKAMMGKPSYWKNKKRPKETCEKISKSKRGIKILSISGDKHPTKRKEVREKISRNAKERYRNPKNNPMYGKSLYNIWVDKHGLEVANIKWKEYKNKISVSMKGKTRSEKTLKKMREAAIKNYIKNGRNIPNYNPIACKIIDEYGQKNGYNFQHAENGGEVCIDGYYPDGVDKEKETIIEVDEKHHFNADGILKQRDIKRQNYLENLGYDVIRVRV